ncbi:MAG TPA: RluA family pseudouridine synthase [Tepidisphaeraceae bacterium]|nr:RluA family pseudouridine synthase [Tepidisphaeraceae bacterium]
MSEHPKYSTPATIMEWLLRRYPTAKRQTLRRMVQAGRVLVNDRPVRRVDQPIGPGDVVVSRDQPTAPAAATASRLPFEIVFEDADLLVVKKPAGMLTSTGPREKRPTLLGHVRDYLKHTDPRAQPGLVHRLDRDASGLLVFSKSDLAYQSLKTQFFHHAVDRHYTAIVHGIPDPPADQIESQLVERTDGTVHSTRQVGRGMRAITDYEVLAREKNRALLRLKLQTGRKHQIRVQLAERGHAIVGDRVYGPPTKLAAPRLMLAATHLSFTHPRTGKHLSFDGPAGF